MTTIQAAALITAIPCGIGAIFLLIGYFRGRMTRGWAQATGVVVRRATGARSGGMPAIYPTFQWQDQHGRVHQRTSMVRASLGPSPGKQVPVLFDPQEPSRAIINSYVQSGRIFFLIGTILFAVGLGAGVLAIALSASIA